ncbi:MAG: PEP-CTERM sorting domain-containing protein [Anaerolineae bacterium]|nr:PEP-CTERM sorting domain-containing protein [Gloeobacterales cyanobacterium ES-bin-313]
MLKKFGMAALISLLMPLSAQAATFNFDGGTDFTFNADTTTRAGVGTTAGALNTAAFSAGFGSFFTSDYGRLGALDAGPANNSSHASGSSSASSSQFSFSGIDKITVNFSYAFVGNANPNVDKVDIFLFDPNGPNDSIAVGTLFFTGNTANSNQSFTLTGSALSTFVSGANYQLLFQLSEALGSGNSAFGFDNVSVTGVPEPSPLFGLLAIGSLVGGAVAVRRWRSSGLESA